MAITDWPAGERPREQLLAQRRRPRSTTPSCWPIFLRTGVRGKSAVDLGRDLLERSAR